VIKVGLTGGIGSGKSTVASIFEILGVPVFYADVRAKELMEHHEDIIHFIKKIFGEDSYINGKLNKSHLSAQIFADSKKREQLNSIVHPITIADAEKWMKLQSSAYCIKEAALIFESNAEKKLDIVIGVFSPLELRLERITRRDQISKEEALAKINSQMNEDEKMSKCHFVIHNNEMDMLTHQIMELHQTLLKRAATSKN
jgi:dephospho-CoA kinase